MSTPTIGSTLARRGGVAPGFDLLRVTLALAVVVLHAPFVVIGDDAPSDRFTALIGYAVLGMFFGLSGFLITASAQRLSLRDFLLNRGLRIVPALAVEIALSALILGPIFTTLPLWEYFSDPGTYRYFTNVVGVINYHLPGVFKDHATDVVNTSLWTVPHEVLCYVVMSACVLTGVLRRPGVIVAAALAFGALGVLAFCVPEGVLPPLVQRVADVVLLGRGSRLYVGFLLGIAAYLYRDRLPYDARLFALCLIVVVTAGAIDLFSMRHLPVMPLANALVLPALIYLTVYLGVSNLWVPSAFRRGDYSYGIYLYGWPLQQATVTLFPFVRDPALQCLLAAPLIISFAMVSWHLIEKPVLGLRRKFSFIAGYRLTHEAAPVAATPILDRPAT